MICILLVAGHGTILETQIKNDTSGLYGHLTGVPKALLPGIGGKKILDFWWETVNMRQLFSEVYLVTNADKYKHYERWATANGFPAENVVNDGSTTPEDCLGAVADLELVIRSRRLQDDIMVIAGDMLCSDQNFDIAQVLRFFRSKPGDLAIYYVLEEGERSCSRGIVEVCPDTHRITRFLEKPEEGLTASRLASVVFYCLRRVTLPRLSQFLALQSSAWDRALGRFWEWLINDEKVPVFGMKLPTGFQLIGQVGLSDYIQWLSRYAAKQEGTSGKPITCRTYARYAHWGGRVQVCQVRPLGGQSARMPGTPAGGAECTVFLNHSAIVSATLKCLMKFYNITDHDMPRAVQASFILNVETEELFITAGLQDRVVQVYEGLVYMDFSKDLMDEKGYGEYIPMDMTDLPQFWLAYLCDPSDSGRIHSNVRQRWLNGDTAVVQAMNSFAELTDQARSAFKCKDWSRLAQLMDQNFELRRSVYTDESLGPGNLKMVQIAIQFGSAVKLPGSGGAVVGLCLDSDRLMAMKQAFQEAGCVFCIIVPYDPSSASVQDSDLAP
uniref:Glucuronokinase with putative uridyl pyrophosphorylase n=1 Tax=Paramormyrops kingsleyae TaxID=1676925 RepID=A0A3B3Q8U4_9TELE